MDRTIKLKEVEKSSAEDYFNISNSQSTRGSVRLSKMAVPSKYKAASGEMTKKLHKNKPLRIDRGSKERM